MPQKMQQYFKRMPREHLIQSPSKALSQVKFIPLAILWSTSEFLMKMEGVISKPSQFKLQPQRSRSQNCNLQQMQRMCKQCNNLFLYTLTNLAASHQRRLCALLFSLKLILISCIHYLNPLDFSVQLYLKCYKLGRSQKLSSYTCLSRR